MILGSYYHRSDVAIRGLAVGGDDDARPLSVVSQSKFHGLNRGDHFSDVTTQWGAFFCIFIRNIYRSLLDEYCTVPPDGESDSLVVSSWCSLASSCAGPLPTNIGEDEFRKRNSTIE